MTRHTATREFDVMDGKAVLSSGEVRYTFSVTPGRDAVTWANSVGGFYQPAEPPSVDLHQVEIRMHHSHPWRMVEGFAWDMLSSDVPDAWFIAQIEEQDA
jgi:hypothetical protein